MDYDMLCMLIEAIHSLECQIKESANEIAASIETLESTGNQLANQTTQDRGD